MLSMPRGTDPLIVQRAAREFAQAELADHKYVMVLHDHQANPHVHISVRAESEARQAPEPAQGRPAPLARDLRREAARLGHRRRGDPAGERGVDPQLRAALAHQGRRGGALGDERARAFEVESGLRAQSRGSNRSLDEHCAWPGRLRRSCRSCPGAKRRTVRPLDAVRAHARTEARQGASRPEITADRGPSREACRWLPRSPERGR